MGGGKIYFHATVGEIFSPGNDVLAHAQHSFLFVLTFLNFLLYYRMFVYYISM